MSGNIPPPGRLGALCSKGTGREAELAVFSGVLSREFMASSHAVILPPELVEGSVRVHRSFASPRMTAIDRMTTPKTES